MPSANDFVLRETVRNHPVVVATTAATGGVLLGGFVVVSAVRAVPQTRKPMARRRRKPLPRPRPRSKPVAETTGSALIRRKRRIGRLRSADLALSVARLHGRSTRARIARPRVVSTDKLDKPAVSRDRIAAGHAACGIEALRCAPRHRRLRSLRRAAGRCAACDRTAGGRSSVRRRRRSRRSAAVDGRSRPQPDVASLTPSAAAASKKRAGEEGRTREGQAGQRSQKPQDDGGQIATHDGDRRRASAT